MVGSNSAAVTTEGGKLAPVLVFWKGSLCVGDGLLLLGFMRAIKKQFPQQEQHWLCEGGDYFSRILPELIEGVVDRVISVPK